MMRPAKRKRALLESNPLRNNRRELIAWPDGRFKDFSVRLFSEPRNRFPDALKTQGGVGGGLARPLAWQRRVEGGGPDAASGYYRCGAAKGSRGPALGQGG
jgi:hypothetical protein